MKRLVIAVMLASACYVHGAGVKTGKERLRELVVFPTIDLNRSFPIWPQRQEYIEDHLIPAEIETLRKETSEHPDNPERFLYLAELLNRSEKTNEATAVAIQAEKAARKQSAQRPQDGFALSCLGDALNDQSRETEAESFFRRATQVSSNDWRTWVRWGRFLGNQAFYSLVPTDKSKPAPDSFELIFAAVENFHPSPDVLAKSEAMRKESERCFSRAVELAPKEPDVYLGHAEIRGTLSLADLLARHYRDRQPIDQKQAMTAYCAPESVLDFKQAAQLCPDDGRIIATSAWVEWMYALMNLKQQPSDGQSALDGLPEKTQRDLHEALGKLEALSQTPNTTRAAGAFENLGCLRLLMNDMEGAKSALRRAVTLEPSRERAWESLLGASISSGATPEELVNIGESLIKSNNSARNHVVLAKALVKANRLIDAKKEIQKAEDLEPGNVLTQLFAVALSLKLSGDERYLVDATGQITEANELLKKMPDGAEKPVRLREFLLDAAILDALVDKSEQAMEYLNMVLKQLPDDETAKEIRSAIQ